MDDILGCFWRQYTDFGHFLILVSKIKSATKSKTSFTNDMLPRFVFNMQKQHEIIILYSKNWVEYG